MKHTRTKKASRKNWMAMGALAASAVVAGRPAASYAADLAGAAGHARRGGDAPERLAISRLQVWPEFRGVSLADFDEPRRRRDAWFMGPASVAGPAAVSVAAPTSVSALAADADAAAQRFDIPPGPLGSVLDAFERATGVKVALSNDAIRYLNSPGVTGLFTIEHALQQLLAQTGVTYRFTSALAVMLELRAPSESVEVSGRATAAVSSPKYTEPLRDIPQTITVISSAVMEQQGATSLRDVLRNVSGITFQAGEGGVPAGDNLTIRGFSARTDMFIDGVRDFGGYSRDPFNLEQVEVTKGPASSIAGRGSTGGSINQVTKAPNLAASYGGSLSGGNADFRRTTMDINQPIEGLEGLGLGGAAVRLNAMFTDAGVPGRQVVENERWGIAPSVAFGLGTPTRVTASYLHLAQNNVPEYGIPWVPANTNPELAAYANGRPPVDQSNYYGLKDRDYEKTYTDVATGIVEHDFGVGGSASAGSGGGAAFSLRNLTRYGNTRRDSVITAPRFISVNTSTAINRELKPRDMDDRIVANQTNLTAHVATGRLRHEVVAGVEISRESSENHTKTGPVAPLADLYHPNPDDPYLGPITPTGAWTKGTADSAGVYAFDTVKPNEHWELTGGLRFDRFHVDYDSFDTAGVLTPRTRTDKEPSWRAAAVYKPRATSSVYVGYGTSFNPSAEGLALTDATVRLEPEKTKNLEAGTKWDVLRERLSLTAAVFRTEKTNARTPGVNAGDPPTVVAGKQIVDGLELGWSGRVNDRWTAFGSLSFMHSDIAASNTPAEVDGALALTPKRTFNLWTTYAFPWKLTLGGGVQYMDSVFRNATNTASVPSYWLASALVSYDVNRHLTLRLNADNIANTDYVDRVGGGHYIPGPGRAVMVTTGFKF
jgi:catecholate siderophore receptor